MNLYTVIINDEEYSVPASGMMSAIRKAVFLDNEDRRENYWFLLDRELRDASIEISVRLEVKNLSQDDLEAMTEREQDEPA